MADVNTSKTGSVLYEEFVPLAYELLVDTLPNNYIPPVMATIST